MILNRTARGAWKVESSPSGVGGLPCIWNRNRIEWNRFKEIQFEIHTIYPYLVKFIQEYKLWNIASPSDMIEHSKLVLNDDDTR